MDSQPDRDHPAKREGIYRAVQWLAALDVAAGLALVAVGAWLLESREIAIAGALLAAAGAVLAVVFSVLARQAYGERLTRRDAEAAPPRRRRMPGR